MFWGPLVQKVFFENLSVRKYVRMNVTMGEYLALFIFKSERLTAFYAQYSRSVSILLKVLTKIGKAEV